METMATEILEAGIDKQLSKGTQTVDSFLGGVEGNISSTIKTLESISGVTTTELEAVLDGEFASYATNQLATFESTYLVTDANSIGAAAFYNTQNNSIFVDQSAMHLTMDADYWVGVSAHEEVHKQDQAIEFNCSSISYPNDVIEVNPVLVEWHAITSSGQSDADLTPEYRDHRRRGDALVSYLGSDQLLIKALKTGDMQALQDAIDIRVIKESLQTS